MYVLFLFVVNLFLFLIFVIHLNIINSFSLMPISVILIKPLGFLAPKDFQPSFPEPRHVYNIRHLHCMLANLI